LAREWLREVAAREWRSADFHNYGEGFKVRQSDELVRIVVTRYGLPEALALELVTERQSVTREMEAEQAKALDGVWCSRECRDGQARDAVCKGCGTPLIGKRTGALYCGRTCRMRSVSKQVQDSPIIVKTHIQNMGLSDAKIASGYHPTRRPEIAVIVNRIEAQSA
jgi:hypothetical protein